MGIQASVSISEIRARGSIKDSDVLRMRRAFHDDPGLSADDAEALLVLNETCPIKDPAWAELLIEAMTEYVVHQLKPDGYMEARKTDWLMQRLAPDGRLLGSTEVELVVSVLDKARWSPPSLVGFALEQVRRAVETGAGPLRKANAHEPGTITDGDILLVKRVLRAFGGEASIAITRVEAESLLAIERAVRPGRGSPAWTALFVRAVGNGLLAGLGRAVPMRPELLDEASAEPVATVTSLTGEAISTDGAGWPAPAFDHHAAVRLSAGSGAIWASCRLQSPEERAMARLERQRLEIVTGEAIAEADEAWLVDKLSQQLRLTEAERALLRFVQREANGLPAQLDKIAARAMIAA